MVLDSLGIGYSRDAHIFGDEGANTFGHIAQSCFNGEAEKGRTGPLYVPNLTALGLGEAAKKICRNLSSRAR
jgi:phosphopentomutase